MWASAWEIPSKRCGLRIIRSQYVMLVTFKEIVSKGQKDWRQTTWAIGQVNKRSGREFVEKEQREQLVSEEEDGIDWVILDLVGMMFQTIFQRKSFKRWLRLRFPRKIRKGRGVRRRKRANEMMSWFGRERTRSGRGPEKKFRRVRASNDFKNLRDIGRIKQEMQKDLLPRICRRVNKIGNN
jgi:hypothetical protein